ncbi:MAG: RNA methyltransferase [bacterium]|nr:RNA methyltransferase [bacterium]
MKKTKQIVLILNNTRSIHNVGSIFRIADTAGVSKIYLTGYTPTPQDRFGRIQKEIKKTALGAEEIVPWEHVSRIGDVLKKLKKEHFYIVGVEQSKKSVDYKTVQQKQKTVFVFGNEVNGLSDAVLKHCDTIVEIPMRGKKESLNISVAAGIVLFRILNI